MTPDRSPTPFEKRVYEALGKIPCGKVTTYGELARHLGVRSPRAVGQALKRNPDAPEVPCHRVICSNRNIGGYQGEGSSQKKKRLLCREGVRFEKPGTVDHSSLYCFRD